MSAANPRGVVGEDGEAVQAAALIAGRGARQTRARIQALAVLLRSRRALSHHDIEAAMGGLQDIDRVTLYRVLEWLTEQGLAHKLVDEDRVWRFSAVGGEHAHFQCNQCGEVICLSETKVPAIRLPDGFHRNEVEVVVKGSCADCGRPIAGDRR